VLYKIDDEMIVLDCGSGIRVLASELMQQKHPIKATVLLSHYHWDHMLGLPFFVPMYMPSTQLTFYGERKDAQGVEEEVKKQFTGPNFPVEQKDLNSQLIFKEITPGEEFKVGEAVIKPFRLNHPNLCLGYRLECRDTAIVYATDHEHGTDYDDGLIEMSRGADALIFDSMYTEEEYAKRAKGWGHSTWNEGVRVATAAEVKNLFLFHHEPERSDDAVDAIEADATREFRGAVAAREGVEYSF
jgi:phosphoribosyl 1,2-cyclic phosphodiesterase